MIIRDNVRERKMKMGRVLEFFIVGLVMGITEDIIAVSASTDAPITWKMILIVTIVAVPFAIISELIVDHFKPFNGKK